MERCEAEQSPSSLAAIASSWQNHAAAWAAAVAAREKTNHRKGHLSSCLSCADKRVSLKKTVGFYYFFL